MKKSAIKIQAKGSVTSPKGFVASGLHAGIKQDKKKWDSALIYSKAPCSAAATFTQNKVKAWPLLYSMKVLRSAKHHGILASSGNANCVNGPLGDKAVRESVQLAARLLKVKRTELFVAQTGVIGVPFPITRFKRALPILVKKLSRKGASEAAKGILTTDTKTKEVAVTFQIGRKTVTIGALAKGSGMIHPNMATMLSFVTTDAAISKPLLRRALRAAVNETFNKMSIDNDMSTNDMVVVLANGQSGASTIQAEGKEFKVFKEALTEVCRIVAYKMVEDGEGVGHICILKIKGTKKQSEAEKAARHVANSMLFKTMLAGADPNWGRIIAAIGASGVDFRMEQVDVKIGDASIVSAGKLRALNLPKARRVLKQLKYTIEVTLGKGG